MTSQSGLQAIAIHILPNISQSKSDQAMKFDQLIEHNKKNICLQKLCRKRGQETTSRPPFLAHILCMIFHQKYFSYCILLTDQISLSDCLHVWRYWEICVLQLFVNQAVTS